jgi:hypothetical protein
MIHHRTITLACVLAIACAAVDAHAAPTKEECVDAHGKGQDAREAGQLGRAGKIFLTCAQPACPDLVRADCARLADELSRITPTVTFAARDAAQNDLPDTAVNDLPDTAVWVDGALLASQLGDGKAYEIDPGKHTVRFVRGGDEVTVTVVVAQGEKARAVVGTFGAAPPAAKGAPAAPPSAPEPPAPRRGSGPLVLTGIGAAAAAAGAVLFGLGFARMPSTCSLSTHTCAAPPGDSSLGRASSAVTLMNVGGVGGGVGVAALGGSLIWYFAQPLRPAKTGAVTPWIGAGSVGLSGVF